MDVSVVMPLYNKARWVQRALDSLSRQTKQSFEAVVVDDGSTDGGRVIVREHGDPRVRVVRQKRAGPGAARNAGVALTTGRLLAFLDADDEWAPTYLQDAVAALDAHPWAAAVTFGHHVMPGDAARQRLWKKRRLPWGMWACSPNTPAEQLQHVLAYVSPCSTVIRREIFERHGGFFAEDRCSYGEDAWLFLRVLLAEAVLLMPQQRVTFHLNSSGLSHNHGDARPLEPFLVHPHRLADGVRAEHLQVMRELLSIRASKTACMLAFWGRHEEARRLLQRFEGDRTPGQPWSTRAELAASAPGHWAATAARLLPQVRRWAGRRHARVLPAEAPALDPVPLAFGAELSALSDVATPIRSVPNVTAAPAQAPADVHIREASSADIFGGLPSMDDLDQSTPLMSNDRFPSESSGRSGTHRVDALARRLRS